jgi:hypothetical protein
MKNVFRVSLVVAEFEEDPDQISRATNLSPRLIWRPGDLIGHSSVERTDNGWIYVAPGDELEDLHLQVERMLDSLGESFGYFAAMSRRCYLEVSCVVKVYDSVPAMNFPSGVVRRIADLGAEIDIDFYYLVESDGEES